MNVVIVGASPAGVATALLLARRGVGVTLVERETSFERVFRGEGLMPSGVDALLQMGLGGVLASAPSRRVESWHSWIDGRQAFTLPEPLAKLGERAMRVVSRPALLEKMVEAAGRFPSFWFEPGTRVRDLLRAGDRVAGVRVETASAATGRKTERSAGCASSTVRTVIASTRRWLLNDSPQRVHLLLGRQFEERAQGALGQDPLRQGITEASHDFQDLGCEIKRTQDLGHAGARHSELAGQMSPRRARPHAQHALPLLRHGNRIAIQLGGDSVRVEELGRRCALEVVGQPRCSPRPQPGPAEECKIEGSSGFPPPRGAPLGHSF